MLLFSQPPKTSVIGPICFDEVTRRMVKVIQQSACVGFIAVSPESDACGCGCRAIVIRKYRIVLPHVKKIPIFLCGIAPHIVALHDRDAFSDPEELFLELLFELYPEEPEYTPEEETLIRQQLLGPWVIDPETEQIRW